MATCTVPWRSSGGRGEFEYRPSHALADREIRLYLEPLNLTMRAEVTAQKRQGKPRLRKFNKDDRQKLHLPQLVMALARLPVPARQDKSPSVTFPLENGRFVMEAMHFDIVDDDGMVATLEPLWVSILHTDVVINLQDRFKAIAADIHKLRTIAAKHPDLAHAIKAHSDIVSTGINTAEIRKTADQIIELQRSIFGMTNFGSASVLEEVEAKPPIELEEEISGKEGRILTRLHVYRERDRRLVERAKRHYRNKNGGRLYCEACKLDPIARYGSKGERCIEAHHRTPIAELQPDSVTTVDDLAMVCASCHRVIHGELPSLRVDDVVHPGSGTGAVAN